MENLKKHFWKTRSVIRETADVVTVTFDPGSEAFRYRAGQFINLSLNISQKKITRSYSLSSTPGADEYPAITVKATEDGFASRYIVEHAASITEWEVEGPHGVFYPDEDILKREQLVLVGGGSGITPLFSQLKYFLQYTSATVTLIYSNRDQGDIIFAEALRFYEAIYKGRLKIWYVFTGTGYDAALFENRVEGRITRLMLRKLLRKELQEKVQDAACFLCGPTGFIDTATAALEEMSIPAGQVFREYFKPPAEIAPVALPEQPLEVVINHEGRSVRLLVKPGKTILQAAIDNSVAVNYSCQSGTCGTCAAQLLSGKIQMVKNFALSGHLVQMGYVLLCQSHPAEGPVSVQTARLT